jgi:hypothetical protein
VRRWWCRQLGRGRASVDGFIGAHDRGVAWHAYQEGGGGDLAATSAGELCLATTATTGRERGFSPGWRGVLVSQVQLGLKFRDKRPPFSPG